MSHLDSARDVFSIVVCGILMYSRKQSLTHLPILCISHRGHPMAAAVDAAPIRSEWEDIMADSFVVSHSTLLMSRLVRYLPFW